jgi:hypothetical protein
MPELVSLYIRHVLIGFAIAAAFVAMLLWFNVMNMWHLVSTSGVGLLAVTVLWFAHGKRQGVMQAIRVPVRQDRDPRS